MVCRSEISLSKIAEISQLTIKLTVGTDETEIEDRDEGVQDRCHRKQLLRWIMRIE
jgi:hypothetical protein